MTNSDREYENNTAKKIMILLMIILIGSWFYFTYEGINQAEKYDELMAKYKAIKVLN